ncbi:MAG: choice-of-anchor L domain-containing protein, partial [Bacteroidia bacterium]
MLTLKRFPPKLITGVFSVCFLLCISMGFAQPITTSGPPPSFLNMIKNVVSNGGTISNIVVLCDTLNAAGLGFQMGAFGSAPPSNLGLTNGILLTTGTITNAPGPNNATGQGTDLSAPGDTDLDAVIAPTLTFDACIIEFDYVPTCDTFGIQYVFGSEEYPEFVSVGAGGINDVFSFFISGPNPAGGNYTTQNIALIPGTAVPVSINNVNNGTTNTGPCINCAFYVDNTGGASVQYDGFTVPLVASAWVTPGQSYHIKLAIADGSDGILDSGVFLQTLSCLQPTILTATQLQPSIEGCKPGTVQFNVSGHDPSLPFTFNYVLAGTALAGVDFAALSGTYTIPAGQTQGTLSIPTFPDGLAEGTETIQMNISYPSGAGIANATVTINITDQFAVTGVANPAQVCGSSGSTTLSTSIANPAGYSFYWDFNGAITPTTTAFPTVGNNTYLVTVTDPQGCVDTSTIVVPLVSPVTASLAVPDSICINSANNIVYTGTLADTLIWDFGGAVILNGGTMVGPHTVSWTSPGTYTVCVTAINVGCPPSTACKQVVVLPPPIASIQPVADQCLNGNNFNFSFTGTSGFNSIFWDFGNSAVPPNMTGTPFAAGIQYQNPGPKTVTVYVNKYGCTSNLASITFDVLEEPDANFVIGNGVVCQGGCLSFNYSGVMISDPNLMTYQWDFGP